MFLMYWYQKYWPKKKIAFSKDTEKCSIIFSSFISKNLFYKSFFIIQYRLKNKLIVTLLADIYITEYSLIHKKSAKIVCQILEIKLQRLIRIKWWQNLLVELLNKLVTL